MSKLRDEIIRIERDTAKIRQIGAEIRALPPLTMPKPDRQCDVCAKVTWRLHGCWAYGTETWACDDCAGYDAEAYGEEPA